MRKIILAIAILFFLLINTICAQKELWGITTYGGNVSADGYGFGTIFKTDSTGRNPIVVHRFDSINGMKPIGALFQASNGKIYGSASEGGFNYPLGTGGTLFEYDPAIDSFKTVVKFGSTQFPNTNAPTAALIEPTPGLLVGSGGQRGKIYTYNFNTDTITLNATIPSFFSGLVLIDNSLNGSLIKASNGLLYGCTNHNSSNPNGAPYIGSIISLNHSTNTYNVVHPLSSLINTEGWNPMGSLAEWNAGKLYGTTYTGGTNIGIFPYGCGILFEYDISTNTFTKKLDFTDSTGSQPSPLTLAQNNKFYGLTVNGGSNVIDTSQHWGTLFEYDPSTNIYSVKHNFGLDGVGYVTGKNPTGSLLKASNGNLYGMDNEIGIFEYNIATDTVVLTSRWYLTPDFYSGGSINSSLIEICRKPSYKYFSVDTITVCENNSFNYTVHSKNANTYQWNINGGAIATQTDSTLNLNNLQPSNGGIYTCTMTNQCGQTETMNLVIIVDVCTAIDEQLHFVNGITVFPNPFTSQTTITFSEEQKNTTIIITDLVGKKIKTLNFTGRQLVIDKEEMKAGVYFVQTTDGKKNVTNKKIIIQ